VRLALGHGCILLAAILVLGDGRTSDIITCAAWKDCSMGDWHLWAPVMSLVIGCIFLVISRLATAANLCIIHTYLILLVAWLLAGYSFFISTEESSENSVADAGRILGVASPTANLVGFSMASGTLTVLPGWVQHAEMLFEYDCHGKEVSLCAELGLPCDKTFVQPQCHGFILLSAAPLVAAGGGSPIALGFSTQVGLYEDRMTRNLALAEKKREPLGSAGLKGQLWGMSVKNSSGGQKFWNEAHRHMLFPAEKDVGVFDTDGVAKRLTWDALDRWASLAIHQALRKVNSGIEIPQFWIVPRKPQEAWFLQREWAYWQGIAAVIVAGVLSVCAAAYYTLLRATLLTGTQQGFLRGHYWGMSSSCDGRRQRGIDIEQEENELETNSLNDVEHEITFEDVE